ncbi:MAG: sensor histidine kinase [Bacteroidota bacterium]
MSPLSITLIYVAYLGVLFGIAWWTDRSGKKGKSLVNNPYIYALSLGVYCTAWTFYGSVGKAAQSGIDFLPIYIGPTIVAVVWWFVLRKMILISKAQRITSIADFISSRYGKSTFLGVLATLIAVFGIIPYISIQLKATAVSYDILTHEGKQAWTGEELLSIPFYLDTAWYIAIALAAFTILFGTRNLDPNERHEGLVAAVAFESILKLIAFLAIGIFVVFGLFDGFDDLFVQAAQVEAVTSILFLEENGTSGWSWFWLLFISMSAILFLPRQFHVAVVENTNPRFVKKAAWVFPFYLLLINLFVLPIAVGGTLLLGADADADMFVLSLPIAEGKNILALFVALGGFSASASMVIVAVTALGIMISNHIVMPFLLRYSTIKTTMAVDISDKLLGIRRVSIVMVMILAYGYFKFVSSQYTLVSIGLISFVAVAQFAPAIIGGLFWKRATRQGAITGLLLGFIIWFFCLPLPTLTEIGLITEDLVENGAFGLSFFKPHQLFGITGMDHISHGAFWSLLFNTTAYVGISLQTRLSPLELSQADLFVHIEKYQSGISEYDLLKRQAKVKDIEEIMIRFLGAVRTRYLLSSYEKENDVDISKIDAADEELIRLAEVHLTGAIGAASSKIILNYVVKEDPISLEEMFDFLEQTKEIIQYSKELEQKSSELELSTQQLRAANAQLKELDLLKADFITTITHELRTPITSIKSLAKILVDNHHLPLDQQQQYLGIIVGESERITRLVNQVLDLEKLQNAKGNWVFEALDLKEIAQLCCNSVAAAVKAQHISLTCVFPETPVRVLGMQDKLIQAVLNLLSNAMKFCDADAGKITVHLTEEQNKAIISVQDNGVGIPETEQELIFEKFTQLTDRQLGKPKGTGLGLPITKEIIKRHGGDIVVKSRCATGTIFSICLPLLDEKVS